MQWDEARRIFQQLQDTIRDDAELLELANDLITRAVRYARVRTDWQLADCDRRQEIDGSRTAAHNVLIDACNILSRAMSERGKDISWRAQLGQDRKSIGGISLATCPACSVYWQAKLNRCPAQSFLFVS
jgi:hypothetical protein